jgi:hypothetical protein
MLRPSFLLPEEDEKEYTELLVALENEYKPAGPTECFLVSEIAEAQCRLRRITSVEGDLLQATGARYLADGLCQSLRSPRQAQPLRVHPATQLVPRRQGATHHPERETKGLNGTRRIKANSHFKAR